MKPLSLFISFFILFASFSFFLFFLIFSIFPKSSFFLLGSGHRRIRPSCPISAIGRLFLSRFARTILSPSRLAALARPLRSQCECSVLLSLYSRRIESAALLRPFAEILSGACNFFPFFLHISNFLCNFAAQNRNNNCYA